MDFYELSKFFMPGIFVFGFLLFLSLILFDRRKVIVRGIEVRLGVIHVGEEEEKIIAQAEELREEKRKEFKGPWTLDSKVKPYTPKGFQLLRAKETVEELGKKKDE